MSPRTKITDMSEEEIGKYADKTLGMKKKNNGPKKGPDQSAKRADEKEYSQSDNDSESAEGDFPSYNARQMADGNSASKYRDVFLSDKMRPADRVPQIYPGSQFGMNAFLNHESNGNGINDPIARGIEFLNQLGLNPTDVPLDQEAVDGAIRQQGYDPETFEPIGPVGKPVDPNFKRMGMGPQDQAELNHIIEMIGQDVAKQPQQQQQPPPSGGGYTTQDNAQKLIDVLKQLRM
jgi:hypothetical protein